MVKLALSYLTYSILIEGPFHIVIDDHNWSSFNKKTVIAIEEEYIGRGGVILSEKNQDDSRPSVTDNVVQLDGGERMFEETTIVITFILIRRCVLIYVFRLKWRYEIKIFHLSPKPNLF